MPKFGTSESEVRTGTGRLVLLAETDEQCTTCEDSADGPFNLHVIRESPMIVEMICPNCGTAKTVFPTDVKRKLSDAERSVVAARIAAATQKVQPVAVPQTVEPKAQPAKRAKTANKPAKQSTKKPTKKPAKAKRKG